MAFKRLASEQQEPIAEVQWLEQWYEALPSVKAKKEALAATYLVKTILKAKSGKGFILFLDSFKVFIWGNSADGKQLKEDLPAITAGKLPLLAQINGKDKITAYIGIDPDSELECKWEEAIEGQLWKVIDCPPS